MSSDDEVADFGRDLVGALDLDVDDTMHIATDLRDDWGLDSMQLLQLVVEIEAMAAPREPGRDIPGLVTLGDAYEYYERLVRGRTS